MKLVHICIVAGAGILFFDVSAQGQVCDRSTEVKLALEEIAQAPCERIDATVLAGITRLSITGTSLKYLQANDLSGLTALEELDLSFNRIESLRGVGHSDLRNLKSLSLSRNRIDRLASSSFSYLVRLEYLDLSRNPILNLDERAFEGLASLNNLNLSITRIRSLPENIFVPLANLVTLAVVETRIQDIPPLLLRANRSLESVSFMGNRLTRISAELFSGLSSLKVLNLAHNRITDVGEVPFQSFANLVDLRLMNNRLASLPRSLCTAMPQMKNVDFSVNRIEELPPCLLIGKEQLFAFRASHNRIRHIPEGFFRGIREAWDISLQHNRIATIGDRAFEGTSLVQSIQLQNNRLEGFDPSLLATSPRLEILRLENNRIRTVGAGLFEVAPNLEAVFVDNNPICDLDTRGLEQLGRFRFLSATKTCLATSRRAEITRQIQDRFRTERVIESIPLNFLQIQARLPVATMRKLLKETWLWQQLATGSVSARCSELSLVNRRCNIVLFGDSTDIQLQTSSSPLTDFLSGPWFSPDRDRRDMDLLSFETNQQMGHFSRWYEGNEFSGEPRIPTGRILETNTGFYSPVSRVGIAFKNNDPDHARSQYPQNPETWTYKGKGFIEIYKLARNVTDDPNLREIENIEGQEAIVGTHDLSHLLAQARIQGKKITRASRKYVLESSTSYEVYHEEPNRPLNWGLRRIYFKLQRPASSDENRALAADLSFHKRSGSQRAWLQFDY